MSDSWIKESRQRVDEAARAAVYKCPKGKEYRGDLSEKSKEELRKARGQMGLRTLKTAEGK